MVYRESVRNGFEWDPLDYIAYGFLQLEEKQPDYLARLRDQRMRLSIRYSEEKSRYDWQILTECDKGTKLVMEGAAPADEEGDSLPLRINSFLRTCGFHVDDSAGFIQ